MEHNNKEHNYGWNKTKGDGEKDRFTRNLENVFAITMWTLATRSIVRN